MINFNKKVQARFDEMCWTGKLFRVAMTGDELWKLYLESFPDEADPIFRDPNSSSHNCNNCKNFIRRYGNVVAIDDTNRLVTMFDVHCDEEFQHVAMALSSAITSSKIAEVFFETFNELYKLPYESCTKQSKVFQLGMAVNHKRYTKEESEKFGVVKPNETRTFNHLHLFVPVQFVDMSGNSVESIMGGYRDAKNVFQRGMEEISLDTLRLVRDLIVQGSLLNGEAHLSKINQIIPFKELYDSLDAASRDNWCWVTSYRMPFAKFKNELIGVLCSELSQGEELNKACESWNKRVDPANYMKAKAPITKKQIEEAKAFVETEGYAESFDRRCATMDDIKATDIKHMNAGTGKIKSVSVFDGVKATAATRHKRSEFDGIEEVGIEKFMSEILPGCTSVEAFLNNAHSGNMMTLTTAKNPDSKPIFKWPNNYSWTFNGNLAGKSEIREAVKSQGGNVEGVLRFSIMWADGEDDNSDLDAHCLEPNGNQIFFGNKQSVYTDGNLDIDITQPQAHKMRSKQDVVENIAFPSMRRMKNGVYKFAVHQYAARNSKGFRAEIEFNGDTYFYEYNRQVSGYVHVAEVTFTDGAFTINHVLPESAVSSKEIYGLESNQFHKVNMICLSPNHWGHNAVGNKHFFFLLEGCKSPVSIRSFHNENLISDLLAHRKVMEVLSANNHIDSTDKQLSGLGFNSTVREELILKLAGTHKRMIKVKF